MAILADRFIALFTENGTTLESSLSELQNAIRTLLLSTEKFTITRFTILSLIPWNRILEK